MTQSEWRVKILGLPEATRGMILSGALMKQPMDYVADDVQQEANELMLDRAIKANSTGAFTFFDALNITINNIKDEFYSWTGWPLNAPAADQSWHNCFNDKITEITEEENIYTAFRAQRPDSLLVDAVYIIIDKITGASPEMVAPASEGEEEERTPWHEKFVDAIDAIFWGACEDYTDDWYASFTDALVATWMVAAIMTRRPRMDKRLWLDYQNLYEGHPLLADSPRWDLPGDWLCDQDNPEHWRSLGLSEASAVRAARRNGEGATR